MKKFTSLIVRSQRRSLSSNALISWGEKSRAVKEAQELSVLDKFASLVTSLTDSQRDKCQRCHIISEKCSNIFLRQTDSIISTQSYNDAIALLSEEFSLMQKDINIIDSGISAEKSNGKAALRALLFRNYLKSIQRASKDGEIINVNITPAKLAAITSSFLVGNSLERLEAHMSLYENLFTQAKLQDCFYTIFEPEISVVSSALGNLPQGGSSSSLPKTHKKAVTKFAKTYLLDKFELNVKSRYVFAWSDPSYTGFKPLDDTHEALASDIAVSRDKFFKEALSVSNNFVSDFTGTVRLRQLDAKERRTTMRTGALFFLGICVLDYAVCVV